MTRAVAEVVLVQLEWAILAYFMAVNTFYAVQLAVASRQMWHTRIIAWNESRWRVLSSSMAPRISVLAPAYNEGLNVRASVRALLQLSYPNLQIVVINDGSKDDTLAVLISEFQLVAVHTIYERRIQTQDVVGLYRSGRHPNLVVVDKRNGGKADALNAGLCNCSGELVCAIDADTLIEPDALQRMVRPFVSEAGVIAAGGTIMVSNGSRVAGGRVVEARVPHRPLAGLQTVEYLRAFLFGRLGWNRLGGNLIISGAFGLFHREEMIRAGGYAHDTVGEDMELVIRLRRSALDRRAAEQSGRISERPAEVDSVLRSGTRVDFIPDPVAWTEVPESLRTLGRQRDRWHRGLADALYRHRDVFGRPRYGLLGMVVFPTFVLIELLAPVIEFVGLAGLAAGIAIGAFDLSFAVLFFAVAYGYGMTLTVLTVALEGLMSKRYPRIGDKLMLMVWACIENLGYRQLTVVWRLRGLFRYLRGGVEWGAMEERGVAHADRGGSRSDPG